MKKKSTIDSFFKRKNVENDMVDASLPTSIPETSTRDKRPKQSPIPESEQNNYFEHDPGSRKQIWDYAVDQRDEIRRCYLKVGPYQPILQEYPKSGPSNHPRRFQSSWFKVHPFLLEYSPLKDAVFCLPCFLFNKPGANSGQRTFTIDGFKNWKKVGGKECVLISHLGREINSCHEVAVKDCANLMKQDQHIDLVFGKYTSQEIENNRLRLKASIDVIRLLVFQGCALRGHDESKYSTNKGNFIEFLKLIASYNDKVAAVVLDNTPQNALYTSPKIQKEILHILANRVKKEICKEIGDAKFCLIVDESRDESKREQMAIVLRFVDKAGFVQEPFFYLVHVSDTKALTLKTVISSSLSHHGLNIHNIQGQGYDEASNMQDEWNGLQALVITDYPYAYYIHCFAHRLQLAIVATSRSVDPIEKFFSKLVHIINLASTSNKQNDELKVAHASETAYLISINELTTGSGLNQSETLQRPGDTRWGSHLRSISSLINMYGATCEVLINIINNGTTSSQRVKAESAYNTLTSFDFVMILHLMQEIMSITDLLCQALQRKSEDILNAIQLVSTTKKLIQEMRDVGRDGLLIKVISFCSKRNIEVPDVNVQFVGRKGRARQQQDDFTVEQHYRTNIFYATIDSQLNELNSRFNEHVMELLSLSSSLNPRSECENFKIDDLCKLVAKYYPQDFTEQERDYLKVQLRYYEIDVVKGPNYPNMSTISSLCQWLVRSTKSDIYPLIYRLIKLLITLPISTATSERAFSVMKIIKTDLRNRMEDDFLTDSMMLYIEREIAEKISTESIIEDFRDLKDFEVLSLQFSF